MHIVHSDQAPNIPCNPVQDSAHLDIVHDDQHNGPFTIVVEAATTGSSTTIAAASTAAASTPLLMR